MIMSLMNHVPEIPDGFVLRLSPFTHLLQDRAVELNPTLRTLLDELVLPAIQNLQAPIRNSVGWIPQVQEL